MRRRIVVVGAGIAGIAAANALTVRYGAKHVVLVDPAPMSMTSDKSLECFRTWVADPPSNHLLHKSVALLEAFCRTAKVPVARRGYLMVTAEPDRLDALVQEMEGIAAISEGELRAVRSESRRSAKHAENEQGASLYPDGESLRRDFPALGESVVGGVHLKRAGWVGAHQLGNRLLEEALAGSLRLVQDEVTSIRARDNAISGVELKSGRALDADIVVNAAGPLAADVAEMLGVALDVALQLSLKVVFRDHLGAIDRDSPLLVSIDPQRLEWDEQVRTALENEGRADLTGELPGFCHVRPEGDHSSPYALASWPLARPVSRPVWPIESDDLYAETVIRGLARFLPSMEQYSERLPPFQVDGGYISSSSSGRPVIGPAGPEGSYVMTGFGGSGVMMAMGAADMLAREILDMAVPSFAKAFKPS